MRRSIVLSSLDRGAWAMPLFSFGISCARFSHGEKTGQDSPRKVAIQEYLTGPGWQKAQIVGLETPL